MIAVRIADDLIELEPGYLSHKVPLDDAAMYLFLRHGPKTRREVAKALFGRVSGRPFTRTVNMLERAVACGWLLQRYDGRESYYGLGAEAREWVIEALGERSGEVAHG